MGSGGGGGGGVGASEGDSTTVPSSTAASGPAAASASAAAETTSAVPPRKRRVGGGVGVGGSTSTAVSRSGGIKGNKSHLFHRKKRHEALHRFSFYLSFGTQATFCLTCFLVLYALVMLCILPMLHVDLGTNPGTPTTPMTGPLQGAHLPKALVLPERQTKRLAEVAHTVRDQFRVLRQGMGVSDETLLRDTIAEYAVLRATKQKQQQAAAAAALSKTTNVVAPSDNLDTIMSISAKDSKKNDIEVHGKMDMGTASQPTPGFFVLGMHRSGTSMLSGLLVQGIGYNVGGPLIGAAFDNAKGFFERIDVVLQNDEFMSSQKIWWSSGVLNYNPDKAFKAYQDGTLSFQQGKVGLKFLMDPKNTPWLQKDPRMCITLPTWTQILSTKAPSVPLPAVVFTYRHPLEVALSLKHREKGFTLQHGLRLWIIYNMRAIQNSAALCRVYSSNDDILASPLIEVQRIADALTETCRVPAGPSRIQPEHVAQFIDADLQHNKKTLEESKTKHTRILKQIKDDTGGRNGKKTEDCLIMDYDSDLSDGSPEKDQELDHYLAAMTIYCDFKSGKAYQQDYEWPKVPP